MNNLERPRGGNYSQARSQRWCSRLVDIALWDLCGSALGTPLYELLGGDSPYAPAYASGLAFHHDDDRVESIYRRFAERGFDAAKVKVGFPTVEEDLRRLRVVADVMGDDARLMVDANEAWSPKEAVRRAHAYRDAGLTPYWIEDPVFREDMAGIRHVVENVPFAHVNTGEYLNVDRKRQLLDAGAVDVLNVHGISSGRQAAVLAQSQGIPTAFGNTPCDVGVHAAAALPEVEYVEFSMHGWDRLLVEPIEFRDGRARAPDRPGHGLTFSEEAFERFELTE